MFVRRIGDPVTLLFQCKQLTLLDVSRGWSQIIAVGEIQVTVSRSVGSQNKRKGSVYGEDDLERVSEVKVRSTQI